MDETPLTLQSLFEQLGLPSDNAAIETFIKDHQLEGDQKLSDAPFWSKAQADFLREQLLADAPWAMVVDDLNAQLHQAL